MVLKKWEVYVIAYTVYHGSFKIHVSWSQYLSKVRSLVDNSCTTLRCNVVIYKDSEGIGLLSHLHIKK